MDVQVQNIDIPENTEEFRIDRLSWDPFAYHTTLQEAKDWVNECKMKNPQAIYRIVKTTQTSSVLFL